MLLGGLALAVLGLVVNGVLPGRVELPGGPPDEIGVIVEISSSQGLRVLVDGVGFGLTWVTLELKTQAILLVNGGLQSIQTRDLEVGQEIQLWYHGAVRKSCPAQVDARFILVSR